MEKAANVKKRTATVRRKNTKSFEPKTIQQRTGQGGKEMKKDPALYVCMFAIWTVLTVFLWLHFIRYFINVPFSGNVSTLAQEIFARVLLVLNAVFISFFWLNGVKDFIYVVWYYAFRNKLLKRFYPVIDVDVSGANDKVLMVYCTCNDFDGESLKKCMRQNYKNVETVILDDSADEDYKKQIDAFSQKNGVRVVRRPDRKGFKAGNINHFLMSEETRQAGYDYVVILDSDEIIPENYIYESLKYFYKYENVGIVQANHVSDRNRNFFMKLFHVGVNSHWPTYQTMKHFYGFSSMLGHGAMIKRECYEKSGGFPELVAEDLCLSIEARDVGYYVAFAPNIICREEYPIDYIAFKKRHSKWTQGNLEFIKKYTGKLARSKMHWYEKMDIVLFTYNLPLTAIFAFFVFLNLLLAPTLRINLGEVYAPWMVVPTFIFFFSPMLNDFVCWTFRLNPLRTLLYTFCVVILYGSMLTTSLFGSILGLFGKKAKFIVTPKSSKKITLAFALAAQCKEIVFSSVLVIISVIFHGGLAPILLIVLTGYASIGLLFFSNKRYTADETEKIDRQTTEISLSANKLFLYADKK